MKKQLLLLFSSMLLLTACGETDSSQGSTSTSVTTSESSTQTSVEPAKIDVTIKVTASGIDEYTGSHSKLYINSNFESNDWNTHAMSQDTDNKDIWTYTFNEIEVDARYKFNIYYGGDEEPDWSNGINGEGSSENPLTVTISEDKTVYEFNSTFTIPKVKHTFNLVLTPHIQSTEGKDDEMYDTTYLWMWCSTASSAALTKQSDGTWTYQVSEYEGNTFQFTPCLGSENQADWSSFQHGAYENGTWTSWNSLNVTLIEGTSSYSYDIYFNGQPAKPVGATYSVIWHYYATSWDNLGGSISVCYKVNGGTLQWAAMPWDEQSNYNYTATGADIPEGATVNYYLYSWKADGDIRYLGDATGAEFSITVSSNLEYILTGDFGASNGVYGAGTATLVTE